MLRFNTNNGIFRPFACLFRKDKRLFRLITLRLYARSIQPADVEQLFTAIETQSVAAVENLIKKDKKLLQVRNRKGWDSLMLAAKSGSTALIELLLEYGAVSTTTTPVGHTALELAQFWNHKSSADILSSGVSSKPSPGSSFFDQNMLVRHANERSNYQKMQDKLQSSSSRFIIMYNAMPVTIGSTDSRPPEKSKEKSALLILDQEQAKPLIKNKAQNVVYLGDFDKRYQTVLHTRSLVLNSGAYFAIDVSKDAMEKLETMFEGCKSNKNYLQLMMLHPVLASLAGQARSLLDWHHRYKFCPTCGSDTVMEEAGYKRKCLNTKCSSLEGIQNTNYPRVDPTVIAAVASRDQQRLLLARKAAFPSGMYSCLAGFVEPGESIESACIREVHEEVGLTVNNVEYHSSQPWPMPSVLMIGCLAYVQCDLSQEIQLDEEELEDASWYSRREVVQMMTHTHQDGLFIPPRQALAHHLVKEWLLRTAFQEAPYL